MASDIAEGIAAVRDALVEKSTVDDGAPNWSAFLSFFLNAAGLAFLATLLLTWPAALQSGFFPHYGLSWGFFSIGAVIGLISPSLVRFNRLSRREWEKEDSSFQNKVRDRLNISLSGVQPIRDRVVGLFPYMNPRSTMIATPAIDDEDLLSQIETYETLLAHYLNMAVAELTDIPQSTEEVLRLSRVERERLAQLTQLRVDIQGTRAVAEECRFQIESILGAWRRRIRRRSLMIPNAALGVVLLASITCCLLGLMAPAITSFLSQISQWPREILGHWH